VAAGFFAVVGSEIGGLNDEEDALIAVIGDHHGTFFERVVENRARAGDNTVIQGVYHVAL